MKRLLASLGAALLAALAIPHANAGIVTSLDDIQFWAGTGSNRTALVIDWNDGIGSESLAWGYRWSGAAPTVFEMLVGLAGAGSGIHARVDTASGFGPGIFGLGFQSGAAPFGITGAVDPAGAATVPVFVAGLSDLNTGNSSIQAPLTSTNATASNPGDRYAEGWFDNGFWELFDGIPGTALTGNWTSNLVGAASPIVPNGWFAFSITTPDYTSQIPDQPLAAIPEPSTALLGGLSLLLLARRRTRPTA